RRRRLELEDLPQHRDPAVGAGARVVCDLPVPVGLERPAHGAGVHPGVRPVADDDPHQPAPLDVRRRVPPAQRRRVPADGRAAPRLLRAPAVLRPGSARRLRQIAEQQIVKLVPHTHWDREWYLPFQSFRLKLVRLLDGVLDLMEADERFVFTLDGQLQTVDDYLAIRPENETRLRALVEEGRLAIGPWQILMDEFLVSGETIWRNLERGLARSDEFGGEMRVGYLPDMFGHIAQMPQILRAFGLDQAVVWRGVPAAIDEHVFEWRGIDGSSVRAEYLPAGYGNAAYLFDVPDRVPQAVERLLESMRPFFGDDAVLAMY